MEPLKDYDALQGYMDRLGLFHMDLGLGRMEAFWAARGMPGIPVVHVVGTNGKGSTSTFLCSIARTHGTKAGLFTSPHFVSPRERVQVNRALLGRDEWVALANEVLTTPGGEALTYFEFQTCLAMLAFEKRNVDMAVMEAGLGGRFDATTVFSPRLTLFTPIDMDHEKILGPTLVDIARDKAGAIHPGSVAVTGPQRAEAMIELANRAEAVGARLIPASDVADPVDGLRLGLSGPHQRDNARLALAGWRVFAAMADIRSEADAEGFGLESAFVPGRLQRVSLGGRTVILDGAHNSHALAALGEALKADGIRPASVIFACLADKDVSAMLPLVRALTDGPVLVPGMDNERAGDAARIASEMGGAARPAATLADALSEAFAARSEAQGPVLICGSLYLLGEFYRMHPEFLTK
ncbi:bifunctional folylpolyglutamate synthase/dihydrofolate synthase [Pseudodesulfovibrio pelocollis]|uniref:bifunctional folylpolyglutamate synthase/dihydrofolate synthase n=1 Tax=Pseudodesulfovibrio pelocollis TaxID=3051432 RepID=UPI00255ADDEC|nr:cyanophycin synthetase [Pseudodesulfovibrio sp. SB368]